MTAEEYYQLGNEARKRGQFHEAINAYIQAIALDPDSPAVEAKKCSTTLWLSIVRICIILKYFKNHGIPWFFYFLFVPLHINLSN